MALVEVEQEQPPTLHIERNQLNAFDFLFNSRVLFKEHPVPEENMLGQIGKGLAQAFASLERGRLGICANSAGKIRRALAEVIGNRRERKWVHLRRTFGELLVKRPAVLEKLGRAAMHVFACQALRNWCAGLGSRQIRDEAAGYVAKVYASEALRDSVVSAFRLQGGRSLVKGNYIGEHLLDYLAALIYEGPNEILTDIGGPNAVVRDIRKGYLEPLLAAFARRRPGESRDELRARHQGRWKLLSSTAWLFLRIFFRPAQRQVDIPGLDAELGKYVRAALSRQRQLGRVNAHI
jgi:hypothetical protein